MAEKTRFNEIIAKCWQDAAFKQRFLSDPKKVLSEYQIDVPAGLDLQVVENTDKKMFITLPMKPPVGELSDNQLDAVSGGAQVAQPAQLTPNAALASKLRTILVHTSNNDNTCSKGKECVPW